MTLRLRLSLAFLLIVIVPLLVAAVVVGRGVPHALDTSAENRLSASRAGASALLQQACLDTRLAAEVLAREAAAAPIGQRSHVAADVVSRGLADYAVLTDASGRIVSRAGSLGGAAGPVTPDDLPSCQSAEAGAASIAVIGDSVGVRAPSGRSLGTAAVATALDEKFARRLATGVDADVTLVDRGHVVSTTVPLSVALDLADEAADLVGTRSHHVDDRLAVAIRAAPTSAVVVLTVSRSSVAGLEQLLVAVLLAALLLSAVIGWWLARVTTRPLVELSDAAARVAAGDLDTRIDVRSRDEIGRLAAAFNEMTTELRSYVGELEASRDQLRVNLARLGDTLSSTHDLGRILGVILDTAMASVRASAGAAYVIQPGRDELLLRAGRGLDGRGASSRIPFGEGVTGAVAATGEARRGQVGDEGLVLASTEPSAAQLISVPLRAGGGVLGVLNLYDRADGAAFENSDLDTIRTFAGQAAVALDNVLLHQEAQRLSVTDALTGLGNYRSFQMTLGREIERATRFERSLALLMLDLDLFKEINDVHGHQVGNAVLIEVAERLRAEVREVDAVARYGGEEFAVVLPESEPDGAGHTAERICAAMRDRPFRVGDRDLRVTVSIGVAVFPQNADGPASLIRAADEALYAAKNAGRDQWRMAGGPSDSDPR